MTDSDDENFETVLSQNYFVRFKIYKKIPEGIITNIINGLKSFYRQKSRIRTIVIKITNELGA